VRLAVVPGRSRIDLTTRPALPGVRLVVESVEGAAGGDPPGSVLNLRVRALTDAGPAAVALPSWLDAGDGTATVEARIDADGLEIEGDAVRARVEVRAGGHVAAVNASGRWRVVSTDGTGADRGPSPTGPATGVPSGAPTGPVEAVGTAVVDLRGLGFGLPPLITYVVQVRWRLLLIPAEPEAAGGADTTATNRTPRPAH
jgi:hypothetical protein